ncbi:Pleckstrin y domain-containing family M member 3 [Nymphon striatum]|nr:Pleckstrin y domain-containing family M member 3 [Nymphon striatum]
MEHTLPTFPSFDYDADKSNAGPRWDKYIQRLEILFEAMNIEADKRKRALLLHYAGERTLDIYDVEKGNTTPTYDSTKSVLTNYFAPKRNVQMAIYNFRSCIQNTNQTLDDYVTTLRQLARTCDFHDSDQEILSQIIQHGTSARLRRRVLRETEITLSDALKTGRALELADKEALAMEKDSIHAVESRKSRQNTKCIFCGGEFPHVGKCPAFGKTCSYCKKKNHFKVACLKLKLKPKPIHEIHDTGDIEQKNSDYDLNNCSDDNYCYYVNQDINSIKCKTPVTTIKLNDVDITFKIDTGASVNIIDENTYRIIGCPPFLRMTSPRLYAYNVAEPLPILGSCELTVKTPSYTQLHVFHVIKGKGGSLLGSDTAQHLQLVKIVNSITSDIHINYPSLCKGIGKLKKFKHFWKVLTLFSHRDVICQLEHLTQINSDVGRCRAWLRMAINDGLLDCYISTIRKDKKALKNFYKPYAYLLDSEHPHVLLSLIQSLGIFSFKLSYNSRLLNKWVPIPLILCGLWAPAMTHDPVMPGVDADAYFKCERENEKESKKKRETEARLSSSEDENPLETLSTSRPRALAVTSADFSDDVIPSTSEQNSLETNNQEQSPEQICNEEKENKRSETVGSWVNINSDIYEAHDCGQNSAGTSPNVGNSLAIKTGWSSPFDNPADNISDSQRINSSYDGYGESYDTLLYNYRDGRKQAIVIGTPNSSDLLFLSEPITYSSSPASSKEESDMGNRNQVIKVNCGFFKSKACIKLDGFTKLFADDTKFYNTVNTIDEHYQLQSDLDNLSNWSEVWQLKFNSSKCKVMHLGHKNPGYKYFMKDASGSIVWLKETEEEKDLGVWVDNKLAFSAHATKAATKSSQLLGESSPDSIDCPTFEIIPNNCSVTSRYADERTQHMLSLIPKICNEKGLFYQKYACADCHQSIGMICKYTNIFLTRMEDEPLIDLRKSNSILYTIVDELQVIQSLRTQLSYLKTYLFSCQERIFEEFRKRIWPKEYLYEHIHLYALSDLLNITNGSLIQYLQKIVNFAIKHVLQCRLCSAKGFICEVCNSTKVIYPFELNKTYRCEGCHAVYHAFCMKDHRPCPKCLRMKQRKIASEDFSVVNYDD